MAENWQGMFPPLRAYLREDYFKPIIDHRFLIKGGSTAEILEETQNLLWDIEPELWLGMGI